MWPSNTLQIPTTDIQSWLSLLSVHCFSLLFILPSFGKSGMSVVVKHEDANKRCPVNNNNSGVQSLCWPLNSALWEPGPDQYLFSCVDCRGMQLSGTSDHLLANDLIAICSFSLHLFLNWPEFHCWKSKYIYELCLHRQHKLRLIIIYQIMKYNECTFLWTAEDISCAV